MLGVLKRRWKPKRASSNRRNSGQGKPEAPLQGDDAVIDKNRTADLSPPHQIHPLCEDKSQFLAYETLSRALHPPPPADAPAYHQHPPTPPSILPAYANPNVANILCVEGGRIEFIKSPPEFGNEQKTTSTLEHVRTVSRGQQTLSREEKSDVAKESLEARVLELEQALEREQSNGIRERLAIARLQRQLARREVHQRDVDRERRLRLDTEVRLRASAGEVDKHRTRLSTLQGELARMEETIRSMLQCKARNDTLKQEKTALTVAYESRIHQFQNTVTKLNQENEALKKQVRHCEAASNDAHIQTALLERIQTLEADNLSLTREADLQRRQYERCLDDVANKVVRALLSQKALREEISGLQRRIVELETQNRALTSVLVQQLQEGGDVRRSPASEGRHRSLEPLTSELMTPSGFSPDTPGTSISTPSTGDIAEEHALVRRRHLRRHGLLDKLCWDEAITSSKSAAVLSSLSSVDPVLWLPVPRRPRSLNLNPTQTMALAATPSLGKCKRRLSTGGEKPPEDGDSPGNRDEGYSTMSSDVQDPLRSDPVSATTRGLEDLKEEADMTVVTVATPGSNKLLSTDDASDPDVVYIPLSLALGFGGNRHSFPPSQNLLPFQHIMRSFSDSHLCLKFTTAPRHDGQSCYSVSSATSSSPSILVLSGGDQKQNHPLRRTKGVNLLATAFEGDEGDDSRSNSGSWCSAGELAVEGCWWDADYVQHWLKLDDTRTTLQQQHRDMMEYDRTEMEDWSMSSEDVVSEQWRRSAGPGSVACESGNPAALPSIQEHNAMELEEDASECLWNNASYLMDRPGGELMTLLMEGEAGGMNIDDDNHCWPYGGTGTTGTSFAPGNFCLASSPGGSWSSTGTNSDCCHSYDCSYSCQGGGGYDSKRSSAALSDDAAESHAVGTDFTRDFYRLVKFESTKSLASTSSRSQVGDGSLSRKVAMDQVAVPRGLDREQALQSVLHFIAEQQQYCASREEEDSGKELCSSRPPSFVQEDREGDTYSGRLNRDECESCAFDENSASPTSDFQRPETCAATECLHNNSLTSDTSTCVPSPGSHPPDDSRVEEDAPQECESDGSRRESLLGSDKALETRICEIIQVQTQDAPSECDSQVNELQRASNNSGSKLTEVILNEQNSFTKHLQDKTFFPGLDLNHCIDLKGLTVTAEYRPIVGDLVGAKRVSPPAPPCVCEEDGVSLTANIAPSVLESRVAHVASVTVLSKHEDGATRAETDEDKRVAKSFEGSFEKCKIKSTTPPSAVEPRPCFLPALSRSSDVLVTVIEEVEEEHVSTVDAGGCCRSENSATGSLHSSVSTPDTVVLRTSIGSGSFIVGDHSSRASSFHDRATSKDVIEELNRMIRKGEDGNDGEVAGVGTSRSRLDTACCCPTGWVHVERDIDFTDPKARANLLDVMLASSDSSVGSSSSDSGDEPADYQRLHRLHRFRRQKKASASREPLGVLRCPAGLSRPSIIGRDDFFVRYGDKERDAVASFDFLEDISTASVSGASSTETSVAPRPLTPPAPPSSDDSDDRTGSGGQISLSDSCAASFSGSSTSLENQA